MMRTHFHTLSVIIASLFVGTNNNQILAQPLLLHGKEYELDPHAYCNIWMDDSRTGTYPDAIKHWKNGSFIPYDSLDLPGKFERGGYNYWIEMEVENASQDTFPLLLFRTRLSDDSIWHFSKNKAPAVKVISPRGEKDPTGNIPYPLYWAYVWPVPPGARDTFLVKYYDFKPAKNFLPFISDARTYSGTYLDFTIRLNWVFLFGFGAAFSVLMFSFSQWIGNKDPAYGWYAAYCAVIAYVAWWNFDAEINSVTFLSDKIEWTYTKTFVHTLLIGLCYTQFIRHFFRKKPVVLEKVTYWFTRFCVGAALVEIVLLNCSLYWSWLFYYWLRMGMVSFALAFLYYIWKIPGRQSRLILYGMLSLNLAELMSNLFPQSYTSQVATFGVLCDLFFFTIALSERHKHEILSKTAELLAAQQQTFEQEREKERLRTRIAQDIHDEVGGSLTKISLAAQVAASLPDLSGQELKDRMAKLGADARYAAGHVREIVFAINPDYDRFEEMQDYFRENAREFWEGTGIEPHFDFEKNHQNPNVPPDVKRQLLLIFKEAQNNVAKHAGARNVWLTLKLTGEFHFELEVRDDGHGFDFSSKNGFTQGLSGMKKRAESIGAVFSVESSPGSGAKLLVSGHL